MGAIKLRSYKNLHIPDKRHLLPKLLHSPKKRMIHPLSAGNLAVVLRKLDFLENKQEK